MADRPTWDCPAYGPEGEAHGALCFFADPGERTCCTEAECHGRLVVERQRVFDRIGELAAAGDPAARQLAADITAPEQLLGGSEQPDT